MTSSKRSESLHERVKYNRNRYRIFLALNNDKINVLTHTRTVKCFVQKAQKIYQKMKSGISNLSFLHSANSMASESEIIASRIPNKNAVLS